MSLHGRARGRPEGQTRRHARTDREARKRRVEPALGQQTLGQQAADAAVRSDTGRLDVAADVGTVPIEPGAIDNDRAAGSAMTTAVGGGPAIGGNGNFSEGDPGGASRLPARDAATQSIAMGSNVQFSQTHSNPAGDDD